MEESCPAPALYRSVSVPCLCIYLPAMVQEDDRRHLFKYANAFRSEIPGIPIIQLACGLTINEVHTSYRRLKVKIVF